MLSWPGASRSGDSAAVSAAAAKAMVTPMSVGSQQPDESAAYRWSKSLSGGVCLIEPRIGRNQSRSRHQARKQRLGRGEPEHGKRAEQQQGDDQYPDLQYADQPQDRDCAKGQSTPDARPNKYGVSDATDRCTRQR